MVSDAASDCLLCEEAIGRALRTIEVRNISNQSTIRFWSDEAGATSGWFFRMKVR